MLEVIVDGGVGSSVTLIETSKNVVIVDTSSPEMRDLLLRRLNELGYEPKDVNAVINTHLHRGHTGNNDIFVNAEVYASPNEYVERCKGCLLYKSRWSGFDFRPVYEFNDDEIMIINTPGHTWGSISVVYGDYVIVGDAIPTKDCIKRRSIPRYVDEIAMRSSLTRILKLGRRIVTGHDGVIEHDRSLEG